MCRGHRVPLTALGPMGWPGLERDRAGPRLPGSPGVWAAAPGMAYLSCSGSELPPQEGLYLRLHRPWGGCVFGGSFCLCSPPAAHPGCWVPGWFVMPAPWYFRSPRPCRLGLLQVQLRPVSQGAFETAFGLHGGGGAAAQDQLAPGSRGCEEDLESGQRWKGGHLREGVGSGPSCTLSTPLEAGGQGASVGSAPLTPSSCPWPVLNLTLT